MILQDMRERITLGNNPMVGDIDAAAVKFPKEAGDIINRLGDYICGEEYTREAIKKDLYILNEKYVNIRDKYLGLVAKAEVKLGVKC